MTPLAITDYTLTTCLGAGRAANWNKIERAESGLKPCDFFEIADLTTWIGEVDGVDHQSLPPPDEANTAAHWRISAGESRSKSSHTRNAMRTKSVARRLSLAGSCSGL